jgi:hypothetical protein
VSAENRLGADQLAGLTPGDAVTIESGTEFGRRRYTPGTVVRVDTAHVVVSCRGPRGGKFVERYGIRDGVRAGGGTRAELVHAEQDGTAARDLLVRQTRQVDVLYRAWSRSRGDVEALRALHAAIGELLVDSPVG